MKQTTNLADGNLSGGLGVNLTLFGIISSILMSKSLELDQTPSYSASDQDLSCLQRLLHLRVLRYSLPKDRVLI